MTLVQKLIQVYEKISHIDKLGHNKSQGYNYVRAADMLITVRSSLLALGVYAEINMTFEGPAYTIARAKDPNAPFSAVNVRCSAIFHDALTSETITASGLGSGADTGDKASYKAQTGAIKYMLRNAFMIPDEGSDPEADESVDEAAEPDFQSARALPPPKKEAPKPEAAKPPKAVIPVSTPTAVGSSTASPDPVSASSQSTSATISAPVEAAAAPTTKTISEPGTAENPRSLSSLPPSEELLKDYRIKFRKLGDELATKYLKASKGLTVGQKLAVFMITTENVSDPKKLTKEQWDDFFAFVEKAKANPEFGLLGLSKLINIASGVEEKEKK